MKKNSKVLQQLSEEMATNSTVLQQLQAEQKKNDEAEQQELSSAQTIRDLRGEVSRLQVQLNAAAHKAEAESAAAAQHAQHAQEQVSLHTAQLKSVSQDMQAEVKELQQQLSDAKKLQKQLSQSSMSVELDVKKKQLTQVCIKRFPEIVECVEEACIKILSLLMHIFAAT